MSREPPTFFSLPVGDGQPGLRASAPYMATSASPVYSSSGSRHHLRTWTTPGSTSSRPVKKAASSLLTSDEDAYPPGVVTVDIDSPGMLGFH